MQERRFKRRKNLVQIKEFFYRHRCYSFTCCCCFGVICKLHAYYQTWHIIIVFLPLPTLYIYKIAFTTCTVLTQYDYRSLFFVSFIIHSLS